uniref:Uncharacterized protein n=1 Tax=Tanacetum cinerariifolium TaxID=118510 RepID=A0A6L2LB56_TANCI|nr:hypothetical protein [Tanacetum cinerariifolium]
MATNQAIEYAPQRGDLTVESIVFHNNNVVVVYQNFLMKFYCTAIGYDPNPPADDSKDNQFGSSPTNLSNSNFSKDPSKVTAIELIASMIVFNNRGTSVSRLSFSIKKKKGKSQTVTPTLPKSQGHEASGALFKKRSKPKSKTTPETIITPPFESDDDLKEDSDDDVFEVGDNMEEDIQDPKTKETQYHNSTEHTTKEKHKSPSPNRDRPRSSHANKTNAFDFESSSCSETLKPYDNYMLIIERQLTDYNMSMRAILANLKETRDVVKEDHALNKKVLEATEAYTKNSANLTELLSLAALRYDISSLKQDTSEIKSIMTEIFNAFKGMGENVTHTATKELFSHTEGENVDMDAKADVTEEEKVDEKHEPARATNAIPLSAFRPLIRTNLEIEIMTSPSRVNLTDTTIEYLTSQDGVEIKLIGSLRPQPRTDKGKKTAISDEESPRKLVPTLSKLHQDPDEPVRIPYEIHRKLYHLIDDEIQNHLNKEEEIKKKAKEAKL